MTSIPMTIMKSPLPLTTKLLGAQAAEMSSGKHWISSTMLFPKDAIGMLGIFEVIASPEVTGTGPLAVTIAADAGVDTTARGKFCHVPN